MCGPASLRSKTEPRRVAQQRRGRAACAYDCRASRVSKSSAVRRGRSGDLASGKWAGSCASADLLTHEAGRAEHQHKYEHEKGENVAIVAAEHAAREIADVTGDKAFDDAEQKSTEHGAADIADAAQYRCGERLQPEHESHEIVAEAV